MAALRPVLSACLALAAGGCAQPPLPHYVDCIGDAWPIPTTVEAVLDGKALASRSAAPGRQYPDRPRRMRREAEVTLNCVLTVGARPACSVVSESAVDLGFGEAAIATARNLIFPEGLPQADVTVRFRIVGPEPPNVECGTDGPILPG